MQNDVNMLIDFEKNIRVAFGKTLHPRKGKFRLFFLSYRKNKTKIDCIKKHLKHVILSKPIPFKKTTFTI